MSYQGGEVYTPYQTVDEVADYTDMMGQASQMNVGASQASEWRQSPTKMLVALWFVVLITYTLLSYFFRRYIA